MSLNQKFNLNKIFKGLVSYAIECQDNAERYLQVPFTPQLWRKRQNLPKAQGLVVGSIVQRKKTIALIDPGDVHCLMIGASGVGKTAHYLYPNLE